MDRRRSAWKRTARDAKEKDPVAKGPNWEQVVQGIERSYTPQPRCHICRLPDRIRAVIDSLLVSKAWGYAQILVHVAPLLEDGPQRDRPDYHSLRRHALNHLAVDRLAIRELVERRAADVGRDIVASNQPLLTSLAVYELIRARGFEEIAEGRVAPTVKEALEAARLLEPIEQEIDRERDRTVLMAFVAEVKEALPESRWEAVAAGVARRLGVNPAELPSLTDEGGPGDR
jgi:hypothetical protein